MARAHYIHWVSDVGGRPLSGASITVYEPGTTTPLAATIYAAASGSSTQSNPLTTASDGSFSIYLEFGQQVDLLIEAAGQVDKTVSYVSVDDDPSAVVRVAGTQTITGTKTFTSPILNNPTLVGPTISGQVLLPDGSIGAPTLARNANADTGINFDAADRIDVAINGALEARITAQGLMSRLMDNGGIVFHLDGLGADPTGSASSSDVLDTALANANAVGGGTVQMGAGTYKFTRMHKILDYVTLAGNGMGTTRVKRAYNADFPLFVCGSGTFGTYTGAGGIHAGVRDFTYDGDYTNNQNVRQAEIDLQGFDNVALRIRMTNFRHSGFEADGDRPAVLFCDVIGVGDGANNSNGSGATTNGTSVQGVMSLYGATNGTLILGNTFRDIATPAIFISGSNLRVVDNHLENNHIHYTDTGGGQLAFGSGNIDSILPKDVLVVGNTIAEAGGRLGTGIEIDLVDGVVIANNIITDQHAYGIIAHDCRRTVIANNIVKNSGKGKALSGIPTVGGIHVVGGLTRSVQGVSIMGNQCYDDQGTKTQDWGIYVDADNGSYVADYITITGNDCRGNVNSAGISLNGTGANKHCFGNWPNTAPQQLSGGLVLGSGMLQQFSGSVPIQQLNVVASATLLSMIQIQRSGSSKVHLGLDASDHFAIINAGATAAPFVVNPATGNTAILSQASATGTGMQIGRTSVEGTLAVVGSAGGSYFSGTAGGDIALSSNPGNLWVGTAGAAALILAANGGQAVRVSSAKDVIIGTGGGAKSTGDTGGYFMLPYSLGKPGTPTAPTGSTGSVQVGLDLTNNKLIVWNGASWLGATLAAY